MAAIRPNSAKITDLPVHLRVQIWNMKTNSIAWMSKKQYDRLMGSDEAVLAGGIKENSDFAKYNYRVDNLTGSKRTIYHIDSGMKPVECMTDELWDEIRRRNPPSPLNKGEDGKPHEEWKRFLATSKEAIAILSEETPEQKAIRELTAKVARIENSSTNNLQITPAETVQQTETDEVIETANERTGEEQLTKPKRGRKKKEL